MSIQRNSLENLLQDFPSDVSNEIRRIFKHQNNVYCQSYSHPLMSGRLVIETEKVCFDYRTASITEISISG